MDNSPIYFQRLARRLDGSFAPSTSWLGGLPRLGDQGWPTQFISDRAQPIPFIAQIDLAAFADQNTTLPKSGSLAFFADGDWGEVLFVPDHMANPLTAFPSATKQEHFGQIRFMTPNGHDPSRPNWGRLAYWPCARVEVRPAARRMDTVYRPRDQPFSYHPLHAMERALREASEKVAAKKSEIRESIWNSKAWLAQDLNRSSGGWLKRLFGRSTLDQQELIAMIDKEVAAGKAKLRAINQHRHDIKELSSAFTALMAEHREDDPLAEDALKAIDTTLAPLSSDLKEAADALGIYPLSFWVRHSTHQAAQATPAHYTTLPLSVRQRLLGDGFGFSPYGSALQMFGPLDPASAVNHHENDETALCLAQELVSSKPGKDVYETVFLMEPEDLATRNWDEIWCENGIY